MAIDGSRSREERRDAGELARDVARAYWKFAYCAARRLCHAIYLTAQELKKITVDLRARTVDALTSAGIHCDSAEAVLKVSPGRDLRIWLSLNIEVAPGEHERHELSARIVAGLTSAGLRLTSSMRFEAPAATERLMRGDALYIEPGASATGNEQPK